MKKKTRNILRLLLLVVLCFSLVMLGRQLIDNSSGSSSYDQALALATSGKKNDSAESEASTQPAEEAQEKPEWVPEPVEDDPYMEQLAQMDLSALREVNPDVLGWILIPDSNVNYPIVQGEDNDFYLKHTWDGKENSVGSIFLEHRNTPDFTDYNTIVYGHNMNDGSMFANLKRYNTNWYWERHPYVYILNDDGVFRYDVFSGYETSTEGTAYGLSFNQAQTRATFLETALKKSTAYFEIRPAMTDRILTLSTCSGAGYSNRWVVHARLKMIPADSVG
ncbi:MAG: class B sortase [Oscillospiraceae bacterium]|nr:class B sortase [Oscillospiraceae bacterium]